MLAVAPLLPTRETRAVQSKLFEALRAVDGVEGILEIQFEHDLVRIGAVPLTPLTDGVNSAIGAERGSDADLSRPEMGLDPVFGLGGENLAHETPEYFADRYWSEPPTLFLQRQN